MNPCEQALQWALQYLVSHKKSNVQHYQKIVQTSYSIVYRIKTTTDIVYLKQTPEALFIEAKTLTFLHAQGCKNIPELLAENGALHCFLMTACGDHSLRQLFQGQIDFNTLKQGILNYTNIQRLLENKVQALLSLSVPDWRLQKFASLYYQLITQESLLIDDGLTRKEIDRLHQLYPLCNQLCEDLLEYTIPETINHCDFHENNMLLDKKTGGINIIDWGETVITHPFFSLNGCLWNITHFNALKQTDSLYLKLQSQCIASWLDLYDKKELLRALSIANQLNGIYAALAYEHMYITTKNQINTVQQEHPGSIAGCLRSFLNLHSTL
ncbi:aminoglycoside phosphotransferase family protein [Legionella oakridgensis]|uniref:Phosphotransferase enzyme family protein n=2 Tax=Legionella oakridgensis TaxID=29423 RepID=A0A0W0X5D1_9GAMM|nr:aminoglycoside phosphotransferase family protein [Legionella oakridgensis]AHE66781.1 putative aminoglycoside phosphotransferase [Legionella oakridgensis ATCC 33761 = DSM 21215]ETO93497.1 putative aminoglycoside phosphotransferase [Legionella oakridgensis RV-2-2007]KTD39819.1 Phosphotransferase enzyme family protein [Legionella oakridgensis]STY19901.1 Phosphotransferase enzyme family [Legionella longbeachae]